VIVRFTSMDQGMMERQGSVPAQQVGMK
jgi:hypothetical protein